MDTTSSKAIINSPSPLSPVIPTSYIQVYINANNGKLPTDIYVESPANLKLAQIDMIAELNNIKVYSNGRKVPAWKAINLSAIKSYTEGVSIAIPCEHDDTDIFVDFTLGYCIRQGTIKINRGINTLYTSIAVIPEKFKFPSGYDIVRQPCGMLRMLPCSGTYMRGTSATLIVWLGPNQSLPTIGKCNDPDYRFPVPITGVNILLPIKVIDCSNRRNKYPTPINAYTKVIKAAIESIRTGVAVYFKSIRADFEFIVDFSSNAHQKASAVTGFIHLSDITNNVNYEVRAQFPINYMSGSLSRAGLNSKQATVEE